MSSVSSPPVMMNGRRHLNQRPSKGRSSETAAENAMSCVFDLLVVDGIVELNDIALALNRVGHVDRRGLHPEQGFGERGLSVPGLPVNQKGLVGVNRRSDLRQNVRFHHQMLERLLSEDCGLSQFSRKPLAADHLRVLIQRHRRGAGIKIVFQILAGKVAAGFGEQENRRSCCPSPAIS